MVFNISHRDGHNFWIISHESNYRLKFSEEPGPDPTELTSRHRCHRNVRRQEEEGVRNMNRGIGLD